MKLNEEIIPNLTVIDLENWSQRWLYSFVGVYKGVIELICYECDVWDSVAVFVRVVEVKYYNFLDAISC